MWSEAHNDSAIDARVAFLPSGQRVVRSGHRKEGQSPMLPFGAVHGACTAAEYSTRRGRGTERPRCIS